MYSNINSIFQQCKTAIPFAPAQQNSCPDTTSLQSPDTALRQREAGVPSGDGRPRGDTSEVTPPAPPRLPGPPQRVPSLRPLPAHTHRGALFPFAGDSSKPEFQACHLFPLPLFLPVFGALDFLPHAWTCRNRRLVWDSETSCPQITSQPEPGFTGMLGAHRGALSIHVRASPEELQIYTVVLLLSRGL